MRPFSLTILIFFALGHGDAQVPFTRSYQLNESNSPININTLIQDSIGYTWIGSDAGLYRFNGKSFTQFADKLQQPVTALGYWNNSILIGYKNGEIRSWRDGELKQVILRKPPSSAITSFHKTTSNTLIITTEEEGLFFLSSNNLSLLNTANGLSDNFVYDALVYQDKIFAGTDRGVNLIQFKGKKMQLRTISTAQGLPDNIIRVLRQMPDTNYCWVGMQEGGVVLMNLQTETIHRPQLAQWAWGQVNDILPVNMHEALIVTESGYLIHAHLQNDSLKIQPYSYDIKIRKLIKDKAGNVWMATNNGLQMNTALLALNITLPPPYQLSRMTALECDASGDIWYAQSQELYRVSPQDFAHPQKIAGLQATITCIYFGERGEIWIGTLGRGLCHLSTGNKLTQVSGIPELENGHILSITGTAKRLWISSLNGIEETEPEYPFRGQLKRLRHHNKLSGTGSDYVYQLYTDRKDRIWMATDGGGVSMYDGSYHLWDSSKGMNSNVIYTLAEDTRGAMWAGSLEKGLFSNSGNSWEHIGQQQGLRDLNISAIRAGAEGKLIVVNREGIEEWYPGSQSFRHYNRRNGLHIDTTSDVLNCITSDRSGNVYVPFEHGFILFKNAGITQDINPMVSINQVNLFYKPTDRNKKEFTHGENNLSFQFESVNYSNPEQVYYRYKLEGYNNDWVYTGDETIAFAQLPPGAYRFLVQASLNTAFKNPSEDSFSFVILSPFWRRWWFIALLVIFLGGLVFGYVKLREQGLKKMSQLQKERMIHEYEHLKSQVNPHFLFNSLNTLTALIEDDPTTAAQYTEHLADLYRNMLSFKDQDLILLAEEYEIITNYIYIQKSRFGTSLRLELSIPPELMQTKKIVPLALQLLIENAIKHNVVSKAKPLVIYVSAKENEITVRNRVQPKISKEKSSGLGLYNIRKRYELLTKREISHGEFNNEYIVTLPLL